MIDANIFHCILNIGYAAKDKKVLTNLKGRINKNNWSIIIESLKLEPCIKIIILSDIKNNAIQTRHPEITNTFIIFFTKFSAIGFECT